jgi:hypothetical protein
LRSGRAAGIHRVADAAEPPRPGIRASSIALTPGTLTIAIDARQPSHALTRAAEELQERGIE